MTFEHNGHIWIEEDWQVSTCALCGQEAGMYRLASKTCPASMEKREAYAREQLRLAELADKRIVQEAPFIRAAIVAKHVLELERFDTKVKQARERLAERLKEVLP